MEEGSGEVDDSEECDESPRRRKSVDAPKPVPGAALGEAGDASVILKAAAEV